MLLYNWSNWERRRIEWAIMWLARCQVPPDCRSFYISFHISHWKARFFLHFIATKNIYLWSALQNTHLALFWNYIQCTALWHTKKDNSFFSSKIFRVLVIPSSKYITECALMELYSVSFPTTQECQKILQIKASDFTWKCCHFVTFGLFFSGGGMFVNHNIIFASFSVLQVTLMYFSCYLWRLLQFIVVSYHEYRRTEH